MSSSNKSTPNFHLEGLESRILLSAVPVYGDAQNIDEPIFADSVLILDPNSNVDGSGDKSGTTSATRANTEESAAAAETGDLFSETAPLIPVNEVFLSGHLEAGSVIHADIIHISDGTLLENVELSAKSIFIGAAEWVGDNTVLADELSVLATQSARAEASLVLAPRLIEATMALGFEDAGFSLNSGEMDYLAAAGLESLVIGLANGAHDVTVDGLAYQGNLLLRSPEDGGEFYILSQIDHSGGILSYEGSGQTQNSSADTITSGNEILVNDSLNLVYVENSGNEFGDNTIYFDTTNGGANPEGGDILISGDILGTEVGNGGTLYLNAGSTGDILIQGGVGTLETLGRIVIVNAHDVTFEGNIILESFEQLEGTGSSSFGATSSNLLLTTGGDFIVNTTNNVSFGGDVESAFQNFEITVDPFATSGKVWFKGDVNLANGDLIIHSANDFEITGSAEIIGALQQTVGASETIFRASLQANTVDLVTQQRIRFLDTVTLLQGDMNLVADDVDFEGGTSSIIGALDTNGNGISQLFLRPTAASVSMDIGNPIGGTGTFQLTSTDIAAIADDFALITIGYHQTGTTSTNAVRIGNASFLDALAVHGGSFLVNGSFNAQTSLLVEADSGLISVTGTQIRVSNEQVNNVWQSSLLTLLAHTGDIQFSNGASLLIDNEDPADTNEGSTIQLTATAGSIINQANSYGFIEARDLNMVAGQSITVLTDVETVTAHSTVEGDIQIDELDQLHVIRGVTANGLIRLSSGGDTVIDLLESETDATDNTVAVEVFGGDLEVDRILAGTLGSVQLDVEGAITGFSQTDRDSLLDLPRVVLSGGYDGTQASAEWILQGVTITLNSSAPTDTFNGSIFRVVASEEPSGTPVRSVYADGVYTLYALPGEATHADLVAVIDSLADFDASITAGTSTLLELPAITLAAGSASPLTAATGSYDFGSTRLDVSALTPGVDANATRILFAADGVGVASADWDAAANLLTLHYVAGVTSVGALRNLINSTTDADLSATLGTGTGTQILGLESASITGGSTPASAVGEFAFADGVLEVIGDSASSALNDVTVYFVGDSELGTSADWNATDGILTIRYVAGETTLADLTTSIATAGAGISANVIRGNAAAVLEIATTELNGGREGVPAAGYLDVDGVSLRVSDHTGTVADSGPTFRLIGALADGDDVALTSQQPVRILSDGDDYTIYALAGTATHSDVLAALNALPDFTAAVVDAHVVGNVLTLNTQSGIGEALNPFQLSVNQVDAINTGSGIVHLQQDDQVSEVGVAIDNQSDFAGDYVAFTVLGGDTTITSNGIQSASNAGVLLDVAGSLTVDGAMHSEGGPLTFLAVDTIQVTDGVELESNGGDVSFASLADLTMAVDAAVLTEGGAVSVDVAGDLTLGILNASVTGASDRDAWGDVALQAAGFIQDHSDRVSVNIVGRSLQMNAGTTIGQLPDAGAERAIEINVVSLAAESDAGVIVIESVADVTVTEVAALTADVLTADGSIVDGPVIATLTGILNNGGGDVLLTSTDNLTAEDSIVTSGAGRIVLIADTLTIKEAITTSGGALSLAATNDFVLGDAAHVSTNGNGEILAISDNTSILAAAGSQVTAVNGSILFDAAQDITLGAVATQAALGLRASNGSILAAAGGVNTRLILSADTLALVAGDSVAGANGSTDALLIDVNAISLSAGTGAVYNLSNDGTLLVDTTSTSVTRFNSLFIETDVSIAPQSDLSILGEGSLTLTVTNGGDLDVAAERVITTTGAGEILLEVAGALTMGSASHIHNVNGSITLDAGNSISVAHVSSVLGAITATSATGSIIDVDPSESEVDFETAGQLTLNASTGVGIESGERQTLSVLLGTLAATTDTGGIYVSSAESFATNGLISSTAGTISILSDDAITVGPNTGGVAIDSAAELVLRAGAALTQLTDGSIEAAEDISLFAGTEITLFSVTTPGNVALESTGAVMGYAEPMVAAITAHGLLLDGIGSMGTPAQRLSLDVAVLAGTVEQGTLAFDNAQSLLLDSVTVNTTAVGPLGALPAVLHEQSGDTLVLNSILDLGVLLGEGLFATIDGDLHVSSAGASAAVAVTEPLPVLWQASAGQTWDGILNLAGGDATLRADGAVEFTSVADFISNGGDLSVSAGDDFTLNAGAALDLLSGSLLVDSDSSVTIAGEIVTTAAVALVAKDSILAGIAGGPLRVNASDLILTAGHAVGTEASVMTTAVAQVSASAGAAGIYLNNTGDVRVTNLGFAVTSYDADSTPNVAFSGFQGGLQTQFSGAIQFDNDGAVTVDPVKSVIQVYPGSEFEFALLMDAAGPDGNDVSVLFEIIRDSGDTIDASEDINTPDLRDGNPPSTAYNATSGVLRVFVQNEVSTVAQIIDAINADVDFAGTAVSVTGPSDGSAVFAVGTSAENAFYAGHGADEGIVSYNAGTTAIGADPIAAYAEIQPADALYAIRVTSTDPGAAANDFVFRLLDDGPGGHLTEATDSAFVAWDESTGALDVYINFGYTTAGEIIDAINLAEAGGTPFVAEFSGSLNPSDADDVIGDASVLMVSNLSAQATIRAVGTHNDITVVSNVAGPLYNGINFRFIDDGSVSVDGVNASFDDVTNIMSIYIDSAVTSAAEVVAALNAEGTFTASLTPELTTANNGTGTIQASHFALRGGSVAVNASVTVAMVGTNNDFIVTADEPGDNQNGIEVVLISDAAIVPGSASASYNDTDAILEIRINPDFATAGGILTAINLGPNAASIPFTASLPADTTGFGGIQLVTYSTTTGGTGSVARAVVDAYGDDNDFELVADSDSTLLQNIRVYIVDDGSIDDGSAVASYISASRSLILNVQSGVTTANTLVAAINSASVPVSATLANASDGSGTFANQLQPFVNGADPIVATLSTVLPNGIEVQLASTLGGVINNDIQVSYALDASLDAGTAAVKLFEADGLRLLQVRFADATTTFRALQDFLDAHSELPFEIVNIAAIESETAGDLSAVSATGNEGSISITATGDMSLLARVTSQTGAVTVTTTDGGDLRFDAATSYIHAIDGIDLDLAGAFINNASLESPLLKVYDASLLRVNTGMLEASAESIRFETNGAVEIDGAGLSLTEADFAVDAADTVWVNGAITASGATTVSIDSGDTITQTALASFAAETIRLFAGNEAVLAGASNANVFTLTADQEIRQSGTVATVDTLSVSSLTGAILMSGTATTTSDTGDITYTAAAAIEVTSVVSTDGGDIALISGAAITNVRSIAGTNVATSGHVTLNAETGIGEIADAIRIQSGTLSLNNAGATGDVVVTETEPGADLVINSLTQSATAGRSVLISENGDVHFTGAALQTGTGSFLVDSDARILTDALATITIGGGALTLNAVSGVTLQADLTSDGGDVLIDSGATLAMASEITLSAGGGDVALLASDDVEVAQVLSLMAGVYIASANGSVLRSANDGRTNVRAGNLQFSAGSAIGALSTVEDALIIEVDRMTAHAQDGVLAIDSLNDLSVGETTVAVDYAKADGSIDFDTWMSAQFRTDAGNAVLRGRGALTFEPLAGDLTVQIAGNALISAVGTMLLDGDTQVSTGSAHFTSLDSLTLNGDFTLSDAGTVLIETSGDFSQASTSTLSTSNQDAILNASGAIILHSINAGSGDLALTAGGAISRLSTASATQVVADALRLSSGAAIASVADPLGVDVVTLTAAAVDGIRLNSVGAVEVDRISVTVDTVSSIGETAVETVRTVANQSDISSSAGGDLLLQFGGHLILQDGDDDARAIGTNGTGRIFLGASSLEAYAAIRSLDGDITLEIDGGAHWISVAESAPEADDATISSVRAQTGDIFIRTGADLLMDEGSFIRANSGNIGIDVTGSLTLASIDAALGYVHLKTTGAILDGGNAAVDLIADRLQLEAGTGAGLLGAATYNPLEISANRLSAQITSGPLALSEANAVELGLTTGWVNQLDLDGQASVALDETDALFGINSLGGGSVTLLAAGSITAMAALEESPDRATIRISDTGDLLLEANASGATVTINGDIEAAGGSLTIQGTAGVSLASDTTVATELAGTLTVLSTAGGLSMATGSTLQAALGDIVVNTTGLIAVAGIETAGQVALTSTANSITDNEATRTNVTAATLRLNAYGNVGASTNALDTDVATLAAQTTNGSLYLLEVDGLEIGATEATTALVSADGELTSTPLAELSGIATGGSNGAVIITLAAGDLSVLSGHAVRAAGTGRILLDTPDELIVSDEVLSAEGAITLLSGNDFSLAAGIEISTGGVGQIHLSTEGDLLAAADSRFVASTGNVVLNASGNLLLGGVMTEGRAALVSATGHIRGAGSTAFDQEVIASYLLLQADHSSNGGVGTLVPTTAESFRTQVGRIAAIAGAEGIHLVNSVGVTVGSVLVSTARVTATGSLVSESDLTLSDLTTLSDSASIVLRTTSGSLTLNEGGDLNGASVIAHGAGNVLLSAANNLTANASVLSTSGHLTLRAVNAISLAAGSTVGTGSSGTAFVQSTAGAITMGSAAVVRATGSSALLEAQGSVTVGLLEASSVAIESVTGSILRAAGSGTNVTATNLRLVADTGIASATAALQTDVATLAASTRADGIFLLESNDAIVSADVTVLVSEVNADSSTSLLAGTSLAGLTTAVDGSIVLVSTAGALEIATGAPVVAASAGRIRIEAANALTVDANVQSGTGHVTLLAGDGLSIDSGVSILTGASADIYLDAGAGGLTQTATTITSAGANVRLAATGDITLGRVTGVAISVLSDANILAASGSSDNLAASRLRLNAGAGIGAGNRHLAIAVRELSANALNGSVFISEADDLTVTSVSVATNRVSSTATTATQTDAAQSDLRSGGNGDIVLLSETGSIILNDGNSDSAVVVADGSGSILIGVASDLEVNSAVRSGTGDISLIAGNDLTLASVNVATNGGDISLGAFTGQVTMPATATIAAGTGNLRVSAQGNATIGQLSAEAVSLISEAGDLVSAQFSSINVTADSLRILAQNAIGAADRHLLTDVAQLSAAATDAGIFITESSAITVTSVRVATAGLDTSGNTQTVMDAAQSDVTAGGAIVIVVESGDLTLDDGSALVDQTAADGRDADTIAVQAGGSDGLLLQALDGQLIANASILATTGHLTLRAAESLDINDNVAIATTGAGHVSIESEQGALTFAATASVAGAGSVRLVAETDLTVGQVSGASVALQSTSGAILNDSATSTEVFASEGLRLTAAESIGSASNHLRTNTGVLSALSSVGGLFLTDASSTTVASVRVVTTEFTATAGTQTVVDAAQSDLVTLEDGDIILVLNAGDLTLNDGSTSVSQVGGDNLSANNTAVVADGSGRIYLQAAGSLIANADVLSNTGLITVLAEDQLTLDADVNIQSAADVSLQSTSDAILMEGTATISATDSTLRLDAAAGVTLGNVIADTVSLVAGASIVNAAGSSLNVSADTLRVSSLGGLGVVSRYLTLDVVTLAAHSQNDGIFLTAQNAVTVASVTTSVNEFGANAGNTIVTDAALNHLTALNDGSIVLETLAGSISAPNVIADGSGSVLLRSADALQLTGLLNSGSGLITLQAENAINLGLASALVSDTNDSILLESANGAFTMSGNATITAANANIGIHAADNITLGVTTGAVVSLVSDSGGIRRAATVVTAVLANSLRIETATNVGTLERDFIAEVDLLAIAASSVHLRLIDDTTVGSVEVTLHRLLTDLSTEVVEDVALAGIVTTEGGLIDIRTLTGDLNLSATEGAITSGGTGNVLLTIDGDLDAAADITSGSGSITLDIEGAGALAAAIATSGDVSISTTAAWDMTGTSTVSGTLVAIDSGADLILGNVSGSNVEIHSGAQLLSAAGSTRNVLATTTAMIIADDGIGASGSSYNITVETPVLTVENVTAGSAYLMLFGTTRVDQLDLNNSGSLQLNLSAGDLNLTGGLTLGTGSAVIRVNGALLLGDYITANGDVQLTAQSLEVDAGYSSQTPLIESLQRSIELRVSGAVTLPAGVVLRAAQGDIEMTVGGELTLPVMLADGLISIRGNANVMAAGVGTDQHLLTADTVQLLAGGNLGATGRSIVTDATTLDAQASGTANLVELNDLEIGRYGLRLKDAVDGDSFVLLLDQGTASSLSSVNGEVNVDGNFILRSNGTVTLGTRLINTDGDLFLALGGLQFALTGVEPVFVAGNGLLDLDVGAAGLGAGLSLSAAQLTALVESGDFNAIIRGASEVTADGIVLTDSTGEVTLTVDNGSLTLGGAIIGEGGIELEILDGGLTTTASIADIPLLVAGDQGIQLELATGAEGAAGGAIVTASLEFSAVTDAGNLNFEFRPSGSNVVTNLVNHGLTIRSGGVGNISLLVTGHNLDLQSDVEQAGFGSVSLNVASGGLQMYAGSSILVNSGTLNLAARDLLVVNYIENLTGTTNINSAQGLIVRNTATGTSTINFRGALGPVITLNNSINLLLDVDSATINGVLVERLAGDDYLFVSGTFQ
ncbi:hypothetical protein QEH59_12070 [Coraliomargarita sp. SDUM461004]|uniref:Uncharacterized protein n=1 Tax=Thalassobacterium sedimentorum TaxID=3041258 RepID=A0ABU1AK44_9BACT|nr:hypothetical protein [Coraliomargarita sp. SDUM461004]MDQ8195166.1 hypothetical protein [Coraliomargarita sp. SDUM461004]